jgi:lipoprotein-anchoring transpeptidase ErfK/SrfK
VISRRAIVAVSVTAALAVAAGCGAASAPATTAVPGPAPAPRCDTHAVARLGTATRFAAAVAERPTVAYRSPGAGAVARFGRRDTNGYSTVFAVLAMRRDSRCRPTWYRVQLPIRPNGSSGWVRAGAVALAFVRTEIVIHVHARRLQLRRDGRVVLATPISTGAPDTPTPLGRFYVRERLVPADPNGPWGPAALGTSAYSPVLRSWVEGGPIGIHGTDDPSAIGRAVSHGCIRLPNSAMRRLFAATPAGTPILIEG